MKPSGSNQLAYELVICLDTYEVRHLSMTFRIPLTNRSGHSYLMTKQLTHWIRAQVSGRKIVWYLACADFRIDALLIGFDQPCLAP